MNDAPHAELRKGLDARLDQLLKELDERFLPGETYIEQWGYRTEWGDPPDRPPAFRIPGSQQVLGNV